MKFFGKLLVIGGLALTATTPLILVQKDIIDTNVQYTQYEETPEQYEVTASTFLYYKQLNVNSTSATYELYFNPQQSGTDFVIDYRINNGPWVEYVPPYDDKNDSVEIITFSNLSPNTYYEIDFRLNKTIEQNVSISFTTGKTVDDLSADSLFFIEKELITDTTAELYLNFYSPVNTSYFIEYNIVESTSANSGAPANDQWVVYVPHENDPSTYADFEQVVIDTITPGVYLTPDTEYNVYFRINGVVQNESTTFTTKPATADVQYIDTEPIGVDGDAATTVASTPTSIIFDMHLNGWTPTAGAIGQHSYPTIEYSYKIVYPGGIESTWTPYFISYYGMEYVKTESSIIEDWKIQDDDIDQTPQLEQNPDTRTVNIGYTIYSQGVETAGGAPLIPGTEYQIRFRIDGQAQDEIYTFSTKSTFNANPGIVVGDEEGNAIVEINELKTNEITFTLSFNTLVNDIDSIAYSINGSAPTIYTTYYECNEVDPDDNDPQCSDVGVEGNVNTNNDEDLFTETLTIKNLRPDQDYTINFIVNGVPQKAYFQFSTPIVNNLTPGAATAIIISVIAGVMILSMGGYALYYFKFKDKFK